MNVASFSFPRHVMLACPLNLLSLLLPLGGSVSVQRKLSYCIVHTVGHPFYRFSINTNTERRVLLWVEPDSASHWEPFSAGLWKGHDPMLDNITC